MSKYTLNDAEDFNMRLKGLNNLAESSIKLDVSPGDSRGIAADSEDYDDLGIITMDDIQNYTPDPSLYLVGDGHITRGKDRIHLIVGYAGVGKSRAASYLAYCGATGQKWFDYEVKNKFKTLYLQNENGMARLKNDFDEYSENLKDWVTFSAPKGGLNFGKSNFKQKIRKYILEKDIGMLIIDPWTNLTTDTTHKEYSKLIDQIMDCLPDDPKICPAVMIVAHLRKPDPKTKKLSGIGLMHGVNGSQVLTSRSRFVLAMESIDTSDDTDERVLVTCAKANDAQTMPKSCHVRGKVTFTPVKDSSIDHYTPYNKPGRKPRYKVEDIASLINEGESLLNKDLLKRANKNLGISQSRFNELLKNAVDMNLLNKLENGRYQKYSISK